MKYFIIYNKFSGLAYNRFSEADIKNALTEAGIDFNFFITEGPGEATRAAREACLNVDGPVVACGGDGTVNEVINGITGRGKALGIIPNGTSNLLAEELGITHNLKHVCSVLADRKFRLMDMGKAGDRCFMIMAGIGFDAASIKETDVSQKRFWGWGAYIIAGISTLFKHKRFSVSIKCKEMKEPWKMKVRQIVISNMKTYGTKNIKMAPDARYDDGMLDVNIFRSRSPWAFLMHVLKVVFRSAHLKDKEVVYFRTRKIGIYSKKKIPVHTDCEVIGTLPMDFSVLPEALHVIVP